MTNVETQTQTLTKKRGGAKHGGGHIALLILSTLLLTVAGVFFIFHYNLLGVIALLAGLLARFIDTRI